MKILIKIIKYILPYKKYLFLNIFFNTMSIIFSLFSLAMLIPFLRVIFKLDEVHATLMPFDYSLESIKNNAYYYFTNIIAEKGDFYALTLICIALVILIFFKALFGYMASWCNAPIMNRVSRDIYNKMYRKIIYLPLSYFTEERKGDIMSRMTSDIQEVKVSIVMSIDVFIKNPILITAYMGALFYISTKLTLFILLIAPVSILLIGRVGKSLRGVGSLMQGKMGQILSVVEETLSGLRIIKAFNAEERTSKKFTDFNEEYTRLMNRAIRRNSLASPMSEFLGILILSITMFFGGGLVLSGKGGIGLSPAEFIYYLAIFSQIISPAKQFSMGYYNLQKGSASIDRINKILDAEITICNKPNPLPIKEFKHSVEFKNVSFSYGEKKVLNNINLKLEKGQSIALVGQSGSGKTTLVNMLPRFYDIQEGDILIDGISIKDYDIADLRDLMGIVTQDSILFNDTFHNNIAFGVEGASREDIIAAAKVANAHEFIVETELGYDTNIGDSGSKLSGGQKQRISIARAVLKNPPILILDEATSALDTVSEKLVQEALINLMKNRTSLVIAHRLSTIKKANEIFVMKNGDVVEHGTHADLIEQKGVYQYLHEIQIV